MTWTGISRSRPESRDRSLGSLAGGWWDPWDLEIRVAGRGRGKFSEFTQPQKRTSKNPSQEGKQNRQQRYVTSTHKTHKNAGMWRARRTPGADPGPTTPDTHHTRREHNTRGRRTLDDGRRFFLTNLQAKTMRVQRVLLLVGVWLAMADGLLRPTRPSSIAVPVQRRPPFAFIALGSGRSKSVV